MDPTIYTLATQWLSIDKNVTTRAEIQDLVERGDTVELERRLCHRIEFGTAGLRAKMEAGFSRMNDVTVIQASQGLAQYIRESAAEVSVVIGYDHRHNSERFARLTAAAMLKAGVKVYFYDVLVHTPMVPFGVVFLKATAGVMITASHNPAQDNGYKVYWSNGCQIIPPHDHNIAQKIAANLDPQSWDPDLVDAPDANAVRPLERVQEAYFDALRGSTVVGDSIGAGSFGFVYTPMHGVGLPFMEQALSNLGLKDHMVVVSEQAQPDPTFPTVKFPNPEEKGALDLAIATADRRNLTLILASDPDADRFAAAERLPSGGWHIFTGNQLGVLFAAHIFGKRKSEGENIETLAMLTSTVSTQMLQAMASAEGFHYEETLTGFKWLGNQALVLEERGYDAAYAFEEAIGYMFSPVVHDKDGIAAASIFATMARQLAQEGFTVYQKLDQLFRKYGYFETANSYFVSPDPTSIKIAFAGIRGLGSPHPKKLGNRHITRWRDLTEGFDSATEGGVPVLPVSKDSEMITCELEDNIRFTVRASGTEPKIKMYIECKADSREKARRGAEEVSADLTREWFRLTETGLLLHSLAVN